jgi:alkylated DNA nucleotide flippase Atl1
MTGRPAAVPSGRARAGAPNRTRGAATSAPRTAGTGPDGYACRVLDVVDSISPGSVMSYGDVAEYLGEGGPRQVGRVMALWGGGVAWWRVVHADGSLLAGHEQVALARYEAECTPLRHSGTGQPRVDMTLARWRG